MIFENLWVFHGLIIIPLIIIFLVIENRKKKIALKSFAHPHLLPHLLQIDKRTSVFMKGLFFVLAFFFMIIALTGPKWGSHYQDVIRKGVDIVFMLDVSKSMDAQDVKPSRLERAKREIIDFLKVAGGDRVGLIVFAGDGFVQCPLTLDYDAASMFLDSISTDTVPVSGTDIGKGIKLCLDSFDFKSATDKVIVMITDGEDNEGNGLKWAEKAKDKDVRIFIYGIGEQTGAPVPDKSGGFKKDENGNLILSKLDETSLLKISDLTDGRYVRSIAGDLDLDHLYFDGIRSKTEAKELKSEKIKIYEERFPIFAGLGFMLLIIESLIGLKFKKNKLLLQVVFVFILVFANNPGFAKENGSALYSKGLFKEAEEAFLEKDLKNPKDVRNRYNRGCAAYKSSNYEGAAAAFQSVLKRTDNKKLVSKAAYNFGNTLFVTGDYQAASQSFKKALKLNPADEDARYNFELALKMQKELEKNKTGQNNQKQEQNSRDNNDQKKETEKNKTDSDNQKNSTPDENKIDSDPDKQNSAKKNENNDKREGENSTGGESSNNGIKQDSPVQNKPAENTDPYAGEDNKKKMGPKEAEALLDNVSEDPTSINRFRFKEKNNAYPASGKDW